MAKTGPVPVSVTIQKAGTGSHLDLDDITEISGGAINIEKVDTTAFSDAVKTMGPTGVKRVDDIVLRGFYDPAANTAWTRIGEPQTDPGATPDVLTIKFTNGTSRAYQVFCERRDPIPSLDDQTRFEAVFYIAGTTLTEDYTP